MRRLTALLLTLALLACAGLSTAAPEGWERRNGAWRNIGVQNDARAQDRGGAFYLNLEDLRLEIMPWRDGSGDVLTLRPRLNANNLTLTSELVETNYGWQADMLNGDTGNTWELRLVDLQSDKVPEALDSFLSPGLSLIYSIPVADVPLSGEWVPKRIAFGGIAADCTFTVQTDDPDIQRPIWAIDSLAIYHLTKLNNNGHRRYTTGKIAHLPRPIMIGKNATGITGYAFGSWREVSHGVFDKVFNMTEILADPSQTITKFGIGNPTQVHVSAELGLSDTPVGVYSSRIATHTGWWEVTEGGDIDDLNIYAGNDGVQDGWAGIYEGATNPTSFTGIPLLANSGISNVDWPTPEANRAWNAFDYTGGTQPVATVGKYLLFCAGGSFANIAIGIDSATTPQGYTRATVPTSSFDPPATVAGNLLINYKVGAYITIAAASPPVTTATAVDDTSPYKGQSIDLTATVTDGDSVTLEVEWVTGVGVPEGNGTDIPITGSSPFSVEATVDTSALPLGLNDIGVRGRSADGWGALDTVQIDIGLQQPQNAAAVGGDTVVDVSWDAILGATNMILTWATSAPASAGTDIVLAGTAASYQHTGRTNGVEYFYTVAGREADLTEGPFSSPDVSAVAGAPGDGSAGAGLTLDLGLGL